MVLTPNKLPGTHTPHIFYSGIFDYQKLIKVIAGWFANQGYEFHENVFKHKVPSPSGSEQEFKFSGWRKVTEYVQFWIYVHGHIWEIKEIEVLVDGEKKKMAKGKIKFVFTSDVWLDYNGKFNTPVAVKIQKFLHKHVWHKQITGGWEDECYYRMYKLHRVVKEVLNMSTPTNASEIRY
ncbi:hypothetical protein H6503_00835 [Candidatus Woesearchaeota archaeon]|nr:hypothetical protein [Candidatus Woesearchaeota archaeon]